MLLSGWLAAILLLLACVGYLFYVPSLSFLAILSIGVPWLMLGTLFIAVYLGLLGKNRAVFPSVVLLIGFLCFGTIYEFGPTAEVVSKPTSLSVMTYNVRDFNEQGIFKPEDAGDRIVALIEENNPDILCFQEYSRRRTKGFKDYPYQYITPGNSGKSAQAIFSKYPIVDTGAVPFPNSANNTIYADIRFDQDTLRVYNVHLQSYQIYGTLRHIARRFGLELLNNIGSVMEKHQEQARLVTAHQEASPYPSLLCGDFNSTAFTNTYRELQKGMQDSFKEKGSGWGTTYLLGRGVPFRIDYILASEGFEILSHRNFEERLSDHLPVLVTLKPESH